MDTSANSDNMSSLTSQVPQKIMSQIVLDCLLIAWIFLI